MQVTGASRLPSLTSLRFFAALLVVGYHAVPLLFPARVAVAATSVGFVGVTFFFILSGFVLTWSYRPGLGAFYWRRFARVWPLHAASLAVAIWILGDSRQSWGTLAANAFLVHSWVPDREVYFSGNTAAWSLSDEAFFYAILPALFVVAARRKIRRPMVTVGAVVVTALAVCAVVYVATDQAGNEALLYINPVFRSLEFLCGVLIAVALKRGWRPPVADRTALLVAGASLAAAVCVRVALKLAWPEAPVPAELYDTAMIVPFALLIAAVAASDQVGSGVGVLQHRALVKLGEWSFALYLVHSLLAMWLERYDLGSTGLGGLALVVGFVLVSVAASAVIYELLERPAEGWLRRLGPAPQPTRRG